MVNWVATVFVAGLVLGFTVKDIVRWWKARHPPEPTIPLARGMGYEVQTGSVLDRGPGAEELDDELDRELTEAEVAAGVYGEPPIAHGSDEPTWPGSHPSSEAHDHRNASPWAREYKMIASGDLDPKLPPTPEKRIRIAAWLATGIRDQSMFGVEFGANAETIRAILVEPDVRWARNMEMLAMARREQVRSYDPVDGETRFLQAGEMAMKRAASRPHS